MDNNVKKLFNCTQVALYAVILMATGNVRKYLNRFAAFKAFYTSEYLDNIDKQVSEAEKMLNEEQRNAITSADRDEAIVSAKKALKTWRTLRQYINTAYKGNGLKARLNEAGKANYAGAKQLNWAAVKAILKMGGDFVAANLTALIANNNMPKEFVVTYNDAANACLTLIKDFHDASLDKGSQTIHKNEADNGLYETITGILQDGQHLFEDQKAIHRLFVFNTLLKTVKTKLPAHFTGYVSGLNTRPTEGATISINDGQYMAVTDVRGRFAINRLEAATYPLEVTCPGFSAVQQNVAFKPGTGKHIDFMLTPTMQVVKPKTGEGERDERVA